MTNRKAIDVFNKWMDCKDAYQADPSCDGNCYSCEYYASAEEEREAMTMAISALEKQEQANTQNINSMRTSRPNALESLNILEQAKDDKGRVPMSLVRQAFRNVMEQDRWHSVAKFRRKRWDIDLSGIIRNVSAIKPADVLPYSIDPDGTLTITVPKGTYKNINRVLVEEDGTHWGGLYYAD